MGKNDDAGHHPRTCFAELTFTLVKKISLSRHRTKITFAALTKHSINFFMKKSLQLLVASCMLMALTYSCNQTKSSNPALEGTWKMSRLHLKQFDDQVGQLTGELKSLSDSLATAKDSASQQRFQEELMRYQQYLDNLNARKDSSLKNTKWIFKGDSKFEDMESGSKTYKGFWEYNPKSKMLTRYFAADSVKLDLKSDTLDVAYDSLNHIMFVKSK